ncbi:MAG: hypothetical protein MJ219_03810 [Mycoplasmoidaceae bacterium]|nr:hypothetical protein [Mycoplasmoidaceae bacterium]
MEDTTVEIDEQPYTKWEKQGDSGIRIEKPVTGWTTSTNVEVNFASKRQEFNVIINESHVGFTDPEVMNHKVGENITIQCGLDDDSYI